jgi:hypothetical protein
MNTNISGRLLHTYLSKDEIQRRIYTFVPPRSRTFHHTHFLFFSFFADGAQEEYTWHPMQECKKELDKARYACFAHPEHSSQTPAPEKGSRRHSWRNFFSSNGISATIPEVPLAVFESLPVFVGRDNEEPRIGSFSVRPQYSHYLRRLN